MTAAELDRARRMEAAIRRRRLAYLAQLQKERDRQCDLCGGELESIMSDQTRCYALRCPNCWTLERWRVPVCSPRFRFRPTYASEDSPLFENVVRALEDA